MRGEDFTVFLSYCGEHYQDITNKLKMLCHQRKYEYNADTYHEVIIRCHNAIKKKGFLKDKTPYGIESYIIRSYFNLVLEEKRSCINRKRDLNYNSDNINDLYEEWYNDNNNDAIEKIKKDLYIDFSTLYIMSQVENNFPEEYFYLFRLKHLIPGMTYKKLQEKTKLKGVRTKVVTVNKYIQANVTEDEIRKAFYETFRDIL